MEHHVLGGGAYVLPRCCFSLGLGAYDPSGCLTFRMRMRSGTGVVLLMALVALVVGATIAGVLAVRPAELPKPSRGEPVLIECPPSGSDEYFSLGPGLTEDQAYLSRLLRAASAAPLWCGDRMDTAYRFTLVFEWGKTQIVTIRHSGARWLLDGVEFKHPVVARFTVDRRVSRPLSQAEVDAVETTLDADRFWQLQTDEPKHGCCYDGPLWMIESRAPFGYHKVMRAWDRQQVIRSARLLMQLAGLRGEQNTSPDQPDR